MKKRILVIATLLLLCAAVVSAQSADVLTRMIESDQSTVGDTAYFLAVYRGSVSENATAAEAVRALQSEGVCAEDLTADGILTYRVFSGLIMRAFDVKGGFMYSLTKSDRYAFRELQAKGFISAGVDPLDVISGYEALAVINDCLSAFGGE